MQLLYTHNSAGVWSLVSEVRVPDAFEYHAAHGYFHFPLALFGLYQVTSGGGIGAPVSISPKNGFCIDDSYIYNTSVEHSGAFVGNKGAAQNRQSCAASRSAGPTNTTTATRASRSHSPVFPTANTGSGP